MTAPLALVAAVATAAADPLALRAPGPYAGAVAVAGWPDTSLGLWRGRAGLALSLHEGVALALDAAWRWTPHRRDLPGGGRVALDLALAGGPLVPLVVPAAGATLGPQLVLRRHRPRATWAGSLAAPAALVAAPGGPQARVPVFAGNGFTLDRDGLSIGLHVEAGPVWSPGAPLALNGRAGLVLARARRDGASGPAD